MLEYYSLVVNVRPFCCDIITYSCVISEDPNEFLKRNKAQKYSNHTTSIIMVCKISKNIYDLRRFENPTNDGCYLSFKKCDYSKFIEDEE